MVQENIDNFSSEDEAQQILDLQALILKELKDNTSPNDILKQVQQIQREVLEGSEDDLPGIEAYESFEKKGLEPLKQALLSLKSSKLGTDLLLQNKFKELVDAVDMYQDSFDKKEKFIKSNDEEQRKKLHKIPYGKERDEELERLAKLGKEKANQEVIAMIGESSIVPKYIADRVG